MLRFQYDPATGKLMAEVRISWAATRRAAVPEQYHLYERKRK
jgi:hypothetical protein